MSKILFIIFIFISTLSYSHPHVFIKADITVCYNETGINKLRMKYTFDKIFSNDLMQMFDKNKNKKFEASEIVQVKAKAFSNLVNFEYFVYVIQDGRKIKHKSVSGFRATINNGVVTYYFNINTNVDIGNSPTEVKIAVYDYSYYINVDVNKGNPKFEDPDNFIYADKIIKDYKQAYYLKQIYPDCIVLDVYKL